MDHLWASRILNMDLTGADPGPPSHVRVLNSEDLIAYCHDELTPEDRARGWHYEECGGCPARYDGAGCCGFPQRVPNSPDEDIRENDFGFCWADPPDVWDDTTDTTRDYEFTIAFDAETELEAMLAAEALRGFVQRRLKLIDPVLTARANQ